MYLHVVHIKEVRLVNFDLIMEVEMALCKGRGVRKVVDAGAYRAVELGVFGGEMVGVCFFLGLQLAALMKCEGFAGQRK